MLFRTGYFISAVRRPRHPCSRSRVQTRWRSLLLLKQASTRAREHGARSSIVASAQSAEKPMSPASSVRASQHKPNADSMKKPSPNPDQLRSEYQASDFPRGLVRGKYAPRIAKGSNIVVLDPEVAAAFPSSAAVNSALHSLLRLAAATTRTAPRASRPRKTTPAATKRS